MASRPSNTGCVASAHTFPTRIIARQTLAAKEREAKRARERGGLRAEREKD